MPFTNSPETSTYVTKRVSLQREINSRSAAMDKDEDYVNVYFEPIRKRNVQDARHYITKRPGTSLAYTAGSGERRGIYHWADQAKLISAVGDDVTIRNLGTDTTTTLSAFFGTTTGEVGFTEYLYDDNTTVVIATDGTTIKTIATDNTVTAIVDPDLPTPHLPCPVFLDGYLFLVKEDTADIYNSDLNDPTAWTSGNFITAEMEPDYLQKITKINNYLLAFGTYSIEYFWDAGVESGSPMQRNDTPVKINGYLGGFTKWGNTIFFIGNSSFSQPDVYRLDDFKIKGVGTPVISKYLNTINDVKTTWFGNIVAWAGRTFYLMNVGSKTFLYDVDQDLWSRVKYQDEDGFYINYAINVNSPSSYFSYFSMEGSDEDIHVFDEDLYQDASTDFTATVITNPEDFETFNRKTMSRCTVIADQTDDDAFLELSWTDDDFKTFSDPRLINLNQDLASTYQLGQFRRRAFKLEFTENAPLRLQELEVDINRGNT